MQVAAHLIVLATLAVSAFAGNDYESLQARRAACTIEIDSSLKEQLLNYHNDARKLTNADPLEWSNELYCSAQQWANGCQFIHSKTESTGENLGCGYGGDYEPVTALKDWWKENTLYNLGDGFSEGAGHYTQMVWKGTTQVGCAIATCTAGQLGLRGGGKEDATFVVCQYKAPGNVQGQFSEQVSLPLVSREPSAQEDSSSAGSSNKDSTSSDNQTSSQEAGQDSSEGTDRISYQVPTPKQESKNSYRKGRKGQKSKQRKNKKFSQNSQNTDDCEESTESGNTKDGGSWSYSWKTWSWKRSPLAISEPRSDDTLVARVEHLQDGFVKRDAFSFLTKKRLHKRRRASAAMS